jgi:hypothetical protein
MGLFDKIKEQISETVGVDTDALVESTGQVAEVVQNVADTAEAVSDAKDTLTGKE